MNVLLEINEELPNFTVSFENDLSSSRPLKGTNHNSTQNNELHHENCDVFFTLEMFLCTN